MKQCHLLQWIREQFSPPRKTIVAIEKLDTKDLDLAQFQTLVDRIDPNHPDTRVDPETGLRLTSYSADDLTDEHVSRWVRGEVNTAPIAILQAIKARSISARKTVNK